MKNRVQQFMEMEVVQAYYRKNQTYKIQRDVKQREKKGDPGVRQPLQYKLVLSMG